MNSRTVEALVEQYGSPLFVYELDALDAAVMDLRRALPEPSQLYYSVKANPHPMLAATARLAGCHAEVSSPGELTTVTQAGFSGERCLYTGPGKTRKEIAAAIEAGVRRFSVESPVDYRRVADTAAEASTTAECLVRLNAGGPEGAGGLRMTGTASQFGADWTTLVDGVSFAPRQGAQITGVHLFPLSNANDAESLLASLIASITEAAELERELGLRLEVVDLGGGFAAPYATEGSRLNYGALREPLESALDEHLPGWRHGEPVIAFESGRYLVGSTGTLMCSVSDVKQSRERTYVVLDSGINHLGGLSGLGRLLPATISAVPVRDDPRPPHEISAALVGPLCSPADVLARNVSLPALAPGDILTIPNVGAYGLSASLIGFLSRPAAAEIVLRSGSVVHASRWELQRVELGPAPVTPVGIVGNQPEDKEEVVQ